MIVAAIMGDNCNRDQVGYEYEIEFARAHVAAARSGMRALAAFVADGNPLELRSLLRPTHPGPLPLPPLPGAARGRRTARESATCLAARIGHGRA